MERVNGEIIAGAALAFLAILFIAAAMVNPIWAVALSADYILLAVGIAVIGLGFWTRRNNNRMHGHEEEEHHHNPSHSH
jgi:hypothetical protein